MSSKRYRYTGKERDDETGLYYHGARYYAPWLGRWTAADPAGLAGEGNLYSYGGRNPIRFVDDTGGSIIPGKLEAKVEDRAARIEQQKQSVREKTGRELPAPPKLRDFKPSDTLKPVVDSTAANLAAGGAVAAARYLGGVADAAQQATKQSAAKTADEVLKGKTRGAFRLATTGAAKEGIEAITGTDLETATLGEPASPVEESSAQSTELALGLLVGEAAGAGAAETRALEGTTGKTRAPSTPKATVAEAEAVSAGPGATKTEAGIAVSEAEAASGAEAVTAAEARGFKGPGERHIATRVQQGKTRTKAQNTVIEPGVDVAGDVAAINERLAEKVGENFVVNGRTYGVHPETGRLFPISGPGFHRLNRGAHKALGVFNKFGDTPKAHEILGKMHDVGEAEARQALDVWRRTQ